MDRTGTRKDFLPGRRGDRDVKGKQSGKPRFGGVFFVHVICQASTSSGETPRGRMSVSSSSNVRSSSTEAC